MQIITVNKELRDFCRKLNRAEFITVDTEFIRDSTYWPKLCLVQVAGPDEAAIIDPLAEGLDLSPFYKLLANEKVSKVFHAARQDIEIFYHQAKTIPTPLFDTQVAAMVCGFGDSVGYEKLIKKTLNIAVDKSSRFTDWGRRPLSQRQLEYALADVTHLRGAYKIISERVAAQGREQWVSEEMNLLTNSGTYSLRPEDAWKRLKARSGSPKKAAILREVAAWRERLAQSRDIPRARVLKDDALHEIAQQTPKSNDELDRLRAVPKGFSNSKNAHSLIAAVQKGLKVPKDKLPNVERTKHMPTGLTPVIELLKVLLKMKCEEHDVAQKLVASVSDLELLALDDQAGIPAMSGWRREVFGGDALKLIHGQIALSVRGRRIVAAPIATAEKSKPKKQPA
jgi:ribonuclease D